MKMAGKRPEGIRSQKCGPCLGALSKPNGPNAASQGAAFLAASVSTCAKSASLKSWWSWLDLRYFRGRSGPKL